MKVLAEPQKLSCQELLAERNALTLEVKFLKEELAHLKRLIFGQKRERYVPLDSGQLSLGLDDRAQEEESKPESQRIHYERRQSDKPKKIPNRQPFPAHLQRVDIIIEPKEDVSHLKKIGEEITEELEYKPPQFYVRRYIRHKYSRGEDNGVCIGELPWRIIEKGLYGPGLLAHLLISKFVDHLPLYRQHQQFKRQKITLPKSTLNDAITKSYEALLPLYELHRSRILNASYLMIDETPIKIRDKNLKGKCRTGYYWVYYDVLKKQVLFDCQKSRQAASVQENLKHFKGYLQTDDYGAYDAFNKREGIITLACMVHARRKFFEAKDNDPQRSEWMLKAIGKLYQIERQAREAQFSAQERFDLRQEKARPLLEEIKTYLKENSQDSTQVLPKSKMATAINYMLKLWPKLERYITDGRLEIDNNLIENAIRPVALGRKNYLFAGSYQGGKRAALMYSLVATAKLQKINPFEYLEDVLSRIPAHPHRKLAELLPANWKDIKYG